MATEAEKTPDVDEAALKKAANRFDLRRIIGGLFVVYGVIVTIAGITASDADLAKAGGVNINLWTGLGMLALGLFFLAWLWLRPLPAPVPEAASEEQPPPAA
jgi:xanthine/uracil/vitamin C permease (AzgA family)